MKYLETEQNLQDLVVPSGELSKVYANIDSSQTLPTLQDLISGGVSQGEIGVVYRPPVDVADTVNRIHRVFKKFPSAVRLALEQINNYDGVITSFLFYRLVEEDVVLEYPLPLGLSQREARNLRAFQHLDQNRFNNVVQNTFRISAVI